MCRAVISCNICNYYLSLLMDGSCYDLRNMYTNVGVDGKNDFRHTDVGNVIFFLFFLCFYFTVHIVSEF